MPGLSDTAAAIILAEIGDSRALAELRRRLDELLPEASHARIVEAVVALGRVVDRLIAGRCENPDLAWKAIDEGLDANVAIINPLTGRQVNFAKLFTTHPPTEERIARLRAREWAS